MAEPLTSREATERFKPEQNHIWLERNKRAEELLRPILKAGDRIRATKAECCAREATFTFAGWEKGWIVSWSGKSIAPGNVYSVNGKVIKA